MKPKDGVAAVMGLGSVSSMNLGDMDTMPVMVSSIGGVTEEGSCTIAGLHATVGGASGMKRLVMVMLVGMLLVFITLDEATISAVSDRIGTNGLGHVPLKHDGKQSSDNSNGEFSKKDATSARSDSESGTVQKFSSDSLVSIPTNSEDWGTPPARIDWLHVPKTGTSFLYSLLHYSCDSQIAHKSRGAEKAALEKYSNYVIKGGPHTACQVGLRFYHSPLKQEPKRGHKGYAATQVVSMFRNPLKRVASGFVHKFHQCNNNDLTGGLRAGYYCKILQNPLAPPEELAKAKRVVEAYAECVSGCQARMTSGIGNCGHLRDASNVSARTPETSFTIDQVVDMAVSKIHKFAFVGITEKWAESSCLWRRKFQRRSGHPYLVEYTTINNRPSHHKDCEVAVTEHLKSVGWTDPLDEPFYQAAVDLFDKRVGDCRGVSEKLINEHNNNSVHLFADKRG